MNIRPEEINRFKSIEQAKAYRSAMALIQEVQEIENRVKNLDGTDRDINRSTPGDVLIVDGANMFKTGRRLFCRNYHDMHLKFDPASGHVHDFEVRPAVRGTGISPAIMEHHYTTTPLERLGSFIGSFCAGAGSLGPAFPVGMSSGLQPARSERRGTDEYRKGGETVTIDNRTGIITDVDRDRTTVKLHPLARLGLKCIQAFCAHMLQ